MRTKTKALLLALCAVLLVVGTVFVTMAFLTDSDTVTNVFTYGQVDISLDETKVDANGDVIPGEAPTQANEYHLIPGHDYVKDPVIHVDPKSEDCWLFVKLENGLKAIIAEPGVEAQMVANGWECIDEANQIYAYERICTKGENIETFASFTVTDDADVSKYATADNAANSINLIAYAIQADGFDSALEAWNGADIEF